MLFSILSVTFYGYAIISAQSFVDLSDQCSGIQALQEISGTRAQIRLCESKLASEDDYLTIKTLRDRVVNPPQYVLDEAPKDVVAFKNMISNSRMDLLIHDRTELSRYQINDLNNSRAGRIILWVKSKERSIYDIKELIRSGVHIVIDLTQLDFSYQDINEIASTSSHPGLSVTVQPGQLSEYQMKSLSQRNVEIRVR